MRALALATILLLGACTSYRDSGVPLVAASSFDPGQYLGRWFEIASFPTPFQKGCTQTQAVYSATDTAAQIALVNTCQRNGKTRQIAGTAQIVGTAKLDVNLDGVPVTAPYWVLWVDKTYQTAVVGVPSGRAGWVLSRTPTLSAAKLQSARNVLTRNGYDLQNLRMTPQ